MNRDSAGKTLFQDRIHFVPGFRPRKCKDVSGSPCLIWLRNASSLSGLENGTMTVTADSRPASVRRVPRRLDILLHDISGGDAALSLPTHRSRQYAHSRNRTGEPARQHHGHSIFTIHLFGDMWSPEIVGRLADSFGGNLQKAVLILSVALIVASTLWLALALKTIRGIARNSTHA